jgi:hypothetical protein
MPWEAPVYWTHPEGEFPAKLVKVEEQALNRYGAIRSSGRSRRTLNATTASRPNCRNSLR